MQQISTLFALKLNNSYGTNDLAIHQMNAYTQLTSSLMASLSSNTMTLSLTNALFASGPNRPKNLPVYTQQEPLPALSKVYLSISPSLALKARTKNDKKILSASTVKPVGFSSLTTSVGCLLAIHVYQKPHILIGSNNSSPLGSCIICFVIQLWDINFLI